MCERIGLIEEAVTCLDTVIKHFDQTQSGGRDMQYAAATCTLGRVRLRLQQYESSLEAFSLCLAHGATDANGEPMPRVKLQCQIGQALAHFWLRDVPAALRSIEAAVATAGDENGDEVAVIAARTVWGIAGGEGREVAKSHLLER